LKPLADNISSNLAPNGISPEKEDEDPGVRKIEVPLVFDGQFFRLLQTDVAGLDALQNEEEESIKANIARLGQEISEVAKPSRYSKSDLSRWREIFEVYLDARVFFSTAELDHGARSSAAAQKQLIWFQEEIQRRGLSTKFKLPTSQAAYQHFLALNVNLLQNLKFQELNKTAVAKILKSEQYPPPPSPLLHGETNKVQALT
jgi:hypothetical protein